MPGKKKNSWMAHVAQVWKRVKGKMSYKKCLVEAAKSYKKKKT